MRLSNKKAIFATKRGHNCHRITNLKSFDYGNFWIIIAIVWILGAILAYRKIEEWGKSTFETIWYSFFWPVLIPLYLIHVWHNRKKE